MDEEFFLQRLTENYQNPRNFGKLDNYSYFGHFKNPSCGDTFDIYLKLDDNSNIEDVKFSGDGCAISTASMSLFTQDIKGKNVKDILEYKPKNIYDIIGIRISPARINCALVSLNVFNKALQEPKQGE